MAAASQQRRQHRRLTPPLALLAAASVAAAVSLVLLPGAAAAADEAAAPHYPFPPEPFECDVPRETRAMISLRALELLRREGWEHVETGFFASHVRMGGRWWLDGRWWLIDAASACI